MFPSSPSPSSSNENKPVVSDVDDTDSTSASIVLWEKLALVGALVFSLWLLQNDTNGFGVFLALQQHIPSSRIFRALLECNLLLWGTALSLFVWSRNFPVEVIGDLLFQPALSNSVGGGSGSGAGALAAYEPLASSNKKDEAEEQEQEDEDEEVDRDQEEDDYHVGYDRGTKIQIQVPTAASVANAAMDMLLSILVTLVLFTVSAAGYFSSSQHWKLLSHVAAPTFPLLLFVYLCVRAVSPWTQRGGFWILVGITTTAPWHSPVTFRDGFIGDVLTSSVRPLQDISFTLFYILAGLKGWWSQDLSNYSYSSFHASSITITNNNSSSTFLDQADASVPQMEKSWFYYTVVLPMCLVSPLWWRFLQNLRQCYDDRQRWPYLGNALKYFCAAQVAVVGIFFPSQRNRVWFVCCFVLATLYQIYWDIFMDWQLFERTTTRRNQLNNHHHHSFSTSSTWQLRQRRLYKSTTFYWIICIVNVLLRFGWTLTFLPLRYLDAAGVLQGGGGGGGHQQGGTYEHYMNFVLGPVLASAEIVRRTLWGLIRFEWESVKNYLPPDEPEQQHEETSMFLDDKQQQQQQQQIVERLENDSDKDNDSKHYHSRSGGTTELSPMSIIHVPHDHDDHDHHSLFHSATMMTAVGAGNHKYDDMSTMTEGQILRELCLWATAFALLGGLAVAHRETL